MKKEIVIILGLMLFFRTGALKASDRTGYVELTEEAGDFAELYSTFQEPPNNCKGRAMWWWFENAVTKKEIEAELIEMKAKGIGSAMIFPMSHYIHKSVLPGVIPWASEEWGQMVLCAIQKAKELGMKIDLSITYGYPMGGAHITRNSPYSSQCITGPSLKKVRYANYDVKFDGRTGGYCLDHISGEAMDYHLQTILGPLAENPDIASEFGKTFRSIHFDGFEAFLPGNSHYWTTGFEDYFQSIKGYDLVPHLKALWKDTGPTTGKIRYDFTDVLAQKVLDEHFGKSAEWCHSHGLAYSTQVLGTPSDDIDALRYADIKEACSYGATPCTLPGVRPSPTPDVNFPETKMASSATHLWGGQVTGCETYPMYTPILGVSLEKMKRGNDNIFVEGVNFITYHGYLYDSAPYRLENGPIYHASVFIGPIQPWWSYFGNLSAYNTRMSYILRQGKFIADIVVYVPFKDTWRKGIHKSCWEGRGDGATMEFLGDVVNPIADNGYDFDFINDTLLLMTEIDGNKLKIKDQEYRIMVLPEARSLPEESLQKVMEFCNSGGIVIATNYKPQWSCGLNDHKARDAEILSLSSDLFGSASGLKGNVYGSGKAYFVTDYNDMITIIGKYIDPDFKLGSPNDNIRYIHRSRNDCEIYFVANISEEEYDLDISLREEGVPQIWNPETGEKEQKWDYRINENRTEMSFNLPPSGSVLIVLTPSTGKEMKVVNSNVDRVINLKEVDAQTIEASVLVDSNGSYNIEVDKNGKTYTGSKVLEELPVPIYVRKKMKWKKVWPKKYYSGSHTYNYQVDIPLDYISPDIKLILDLGEVGEIAEVKVNEQLVGVAWKKPKEIDISGFVKVGTNNFEIKVSNLLQNHGLTVYLDCIWTPRSMKLLPSGLIGPVKINLCYQLSINTFSEKGGK